jgi:hypothetical protein
MILQRLDPSRYLTINGVYAFKAILGKLGNPPCKDLDIRGGRVIIDWLPGVEGFCRYVLKRSKAKGSRESYFICHIKPRASLAYSGI